MLVLQACVGVGYGRLDRLAVTSHAEKMASSSCGAGGMFQLASAVRISSLSMRPLRSWVWLGRARLLVSARAARSDEAPRVWPSAQHRVTGTSRLLAGCWEIIGRSGPQCIIRGTLMQGSARLVHGKEGLVHGLMVAVDHKARGIDQPTRLHRGGRPRAGLNRRNGGHICGGRDGGRVGGGRDGGGGRRPGSLGRLLLHG